MPLLTFFGESLFCAHVLLCLIALKYLPKATYTFVDMWLMVIWICCSVIGAYVFGSPRFLV